MDLNKIIIILIAILAVVGCGLIFSMKDTPQSVNNTTNVSSNVTVEQINTEEVATSSSSGSSGASSTHTIMGEDGYYYTVDDNGNILETLGPSKKYYSDRQDSVDYPNAEPGSKYIDKSK